MSGKSFILLHCAERHNCHRNLLAHPQHPHICRGLLSGICICICNGVFICIWVHHHSNHRHDNNHLNNNDDHQRDRNKMGSRYSLSSSGRTQEPVSPHQVAFQLIIIDYYHQ